MRGGRGGIVADLDGGVYTGAGGGETLCFNCENRSCNEIAVPFFNMSLSTPAIFLKNDYTPSSINCLFSFLIKNFGFKRYQTLFCLFANLFYEVSKKSLDISGTTALRFGDFHLLGYV